MVWLDEGIALNFSGEKNRLNNEENFKKFLKEVKQMKRNINSLNELIHGKNFYIENQYNGYDLSYICVRYLLENYDNKHFNDFIRNKDKIIKIGDCILDEALNYFENKLN